MMYCFYGRLSPPAAVATTLLLYFLLSPSPVNAVAVPPIPVLQQTLVPYPAASDVHQVAFAPTTNLLFYCDAAHHVVYMTDTDTGDTEIAAGQYDMGDFLMDEGLDSFLAMMNRPGGLAFAPDDPVDLYVSDTYNHCIRRVDLATMSIWSFAGDCTEQGVLNYPGSLAITDAGTMYILDAGGTILRSLDLATGTVFTDIFAPLSAGSNAGITFAQQASCILVADANHRAVRIFNLTDPSKNAIITTGSFAPIDIGYDPPTGNLYVSSSQYVWIYSLQSKALLSTYMGGER